MFLSKSAAVGKNSAVPSTCIIAAGTVITGNIESAGDIRIDGILKGNLICKSKVFLGPDSVIEGDIIAGQADIQGKVMGKVKINELLHLHGKAVVEGNIHTSKLKIETYASFNGKCHMGANVVELTMDLGKAVNE